MLRSVMVSIIVPTYNERHNVGPLVSRIETAMAGMSYELVFVDDSTDGTEQVIGELAAQRGNIALLHRTGRGGLATAVCDGIARARGEVICVIDADLQHPPEVLPLLAEAVERTRADVAVASRNVAGGGYESFGVMRHLGSRAATQLARICLSRARLVSDPMSGCFAFRADAVRGVALRPLGYKILLEVLARGRVSRVVEVPYRFQARGAGESKLTLRQQWEYVRHLVRLCGAQPDDLRFLRFCLVGASGALLNMAILWALVRGGAPYLCAGGVAIAAATTCNFLLNDAFTWRDRWSSSSVKRATRYLRYWAATGVGSLIQLALLGGLASVGVHYLAANAVGIMAAILWNFWVNNRWTWKANRSAVTRVVYDAPSTAGAHVGPGVKR